MKFAVVRLAAAIVCASLSLAVLPDIAVSRPLDEVVASKKLRVIAYLDNAPFSDQVDGKPVGIEVDLGRAIARELGVEAEVVLRMPGEKADDDLRVNIWRGPLTGGGTGDVMLHVPVDRDFAARNNQAAIGNSYFQERVVLAIHPELTGTNPDFEVFRKLKVGVQLGTVADYFLMTYDNGALIDNISHFVRQGVGAKAFVSKEVTAWLGVKSNIEGILLGTGHKPVFVEPPMDGIVRTNWVVGTAVAENSRDLGYAIGAALEKIRTSGELEKICAAHGVTYTPPPTL